MSRARLIWAYEFRKLGVFYRENWIFMAAGVLALSVVAVHIYFVGQGIPLSIMSSDVIVGLPALFVLVSFSAMALTLTLSAPIGVLLVESKAFRNSIVGAPVVINSGSNCKDTHPGTLLFNWILGLLFVMLITMAMLLWDWPYLSGNYLLLSSIALAVMMLTQILVVSHSDPGFWMFRVKENIFFVFFCSSAQVVVLIGVGAILERWLGENNAQLVVACFVAMIVLAFLQVTTAVVLSKFSQGGGILIRASYVAGFAMVVISVYSPINNFFVGYVLGVGAMGGRGCVVYTWRDDEGVVKELSDAGFRKSVNLRVPASSTDYFYARPWDDESKNIYVIPRSDILKIEDCARK
ncbi:hypothetical protein M2262_003282 [Pseudomonas sp. BIGb0408]|uniref:Uncharacterized protein n=1 Tax=Phytopseudomonas flavescens TaxID=29435 RepID=A0A7Y9XLI9_9GAMM|nr:MULTISPECIES: hypothetical protein [Pseudomonas]MCW2293232.1 hypothetical protein [Pseudomonas sp. BIGb0408]NYH72197.1 hypothetical protein [Pseudomonas flavescens]